MAYWFDNLGRYRPDSAFQLGSPRALYAVGVRNERSHFDSRRFNADLDPSMRAAKRRVGSETDHNWKLTQAVLRRVYVQTVDVVSGSDGVTSGALLLAPNSSQNGETREESVGSQHVEFLVWGSDRSESPFEFIPDMRGPLYGAPEHPLEEMRGKALAYARRTATASVSRAVIATVEETLWLVGEGISKGDPGLLATSGVKILQEGSGDGAPRSEYEIRPARQTGLARTGTTSVAPKATWPERYGEAQRLAKTSGRDIAIDRVETQAVMIEDGHNRGNIERLDRTLKFPTEQTAAEGLVTAGWFAVSDGSARQMAARSPYAALDSAMRHLPGVPVTVYAAVRTRMVEFAGGTGKPTFTAAATGAVTSEITGA